MTIETRAKIETDREPGPDQLPFYLTGVGLWFWATGMQGVLFTWGLVGILGESAARVGIAQTMVMVPGILFVLLGGAVADRVDGRAFLVRIQLLATVPPILLGICVWFGLLGYWTLVAYAFGMGMLAAFGQPGRDALLTRVATGDIQRTIPIVMSIQSAVSVVGTFLAGQADRVGFAPLLAAQAVLFFLSAAVTSRLAPAPPRREEGEALEPMIKGLGGGFLAVWRNQRIFHTIAIIFLSGFFNIGTWVVAFPIIIRDVYGGTAQTYAFMLIAFTSGTIISQQSLRQLMPIARPGRWILMVQVLRGIFMGILATHPPFWAMIVLVVSWGIGAGASGTLSRSIVQLSAPEAQRARVLSVYMLGFMGSAPLGALVMGFLVGWLGPLEALYLGPVASALVVGWALIWTRMWQYRQEPEHFTFGEVAPASLPGPDRQPR